MVRNGPDKKYKLFYTENPIWYEMVMKTNIKYQQILHRKSHMVRNGHGTKRSWCETVVVRNGWYEMDMVQIECLGENVLHPKLV